MHSLFKLYLPQGDGKISTSSPILKSLIEHQSQVEPVSTNHNDKKI